MSGDGNWGKAEVLALLTAPPAIEPSREDYAVPDDFRLIGCNLEYWSGKTRENDGA